MGKSIEVRIALSAIAHERGGNKLFLLLNEDPETKSLSLPYQELLVDDKTGERVVSVAKSCIRAVPDWYSVYQCATIKVGSILYVIYSARVTSNIQPLGNAKWFPLDTLNEFKGRIIENQLSLVTAGINSGH